MPEMASGGGDARRVTPPNLLKRSEDNMAKGQIFMDSATVTPNEKAVAPVGVSQFNGKGSTIHNEMATTTPEKTLESTRKSSGMAWEGDPKKGVVINPMATISPVPQAPSRSTVRPTARPNAWE